METKYVVFDGMDGVGKGTQMKLLKRRLGGSVLFTREPGGTLYAERIRELVRDNPLAPRSTPFAHFLLFWAAREELQQNFVAPTLKAGKHVFSDRGDSSTFAFQLYGEEREELFGVHMLMRSLVFYERGNERRRPDLYVILDVPAEVARERALGDRNRTRTIFDTRDIGYYKRVREGFREFARHAPVAFVDATRTPQEVHEEITLILAQKLNIR